MMPREHGATAMLLIPFFAAAILARELRWSEMAALLAVFCVFAMKDPLVVLARQRWIWKQVRPESSVARRWFIGEALIAAACGAVLAFSWPLWLLMAVGAGAVAFSAIAVYVNVRNRQRSTVFQIVSAFGLCSTSLAACVSATGTVQPWCWWLWALCGLQSAAGIFVVHSRLDARIAVRKGGQSSQTAAIVACVFLIAASALAVLLHLRWVAIALLIAAAAYRYDLQRQKRPEALQMPLKSVGLQAMSLSIAYALMLVVGLW
jgi:hypothetical protein